ncbi:hypothetical protein M413DRAFT_12873 [Hebeloma cylindrosporum]|uniref:G domain-containing protein n=1 Tax=Hebeloma cylindrosporum TaxID=76867 RepID=A0A0C3BNA9_HEBCY|nr:hypothetical protein M413DRAFT_12873 [Hebeloma cylindrosporum h7]
MSDTQQPEKKDLMILVLGVTGAGKSSFINAILEEERMNVGHSLASCTAELGVGYVDEEKTKGYPFLKNYRLVFVDTPGLNDSSMEDFQILEMIATWFKQAYVSLFTKLHRLTEGHNSYARGSKIGGVLYLHDITTSRFDSAAREHLRIFTGLCGDGPIQKVVLATTKWGLNSPNSENHETQLITEYWKPLIDQGAHVRRYDTGHESAWNVITPFLTPINVTTGARNSISPKFSIMNIWRKFMGLFRK